MINDFSKWLSLNEAVSIEQAEKVFIEAEKWAKSLGLDFKIDKNDIHSDGLSYMKL